MHISPLEEYGIRCALTLAHHYQAGPLSASQIAQKEGLSTEYASKIMHLFRKAGLVLAARGTQGGFYLAQKPEEISLSQILTAMQSSQKEKESGDFCGSFTGQESVCVHHSECSLRPVWTLLNSYFDEVLRAVSLKDLTEREDKFHKHMETMIAGKAAVLRDRLKQKAEV